MFEKMNLLKWWMVSESELEEMVNGEKSLSSFPRFSQAINSQGEEYRMLPFKRWLGEQDGC